MSVADVVYSFRVSQQQRFFFLSWLTRQILLLADDEISIFSPVEKARAHL